MPTKTTPAPVETTDTPPSLLESSTESSGSGSDKHKEESEGNNRTSFFLLLLILAVAMAAYGVWRLGGWNQTVSHFKTSINTLLQRLKQRKGTSATGSYTQLPGDLPR